MSTTQAPPPGWVITEYSGGYIAYNPRGGDFLAAEFEDAIYLAWQVEAANREQEARHGLSRVDS